MPLHICPAPPTTPTDPAGYADGMGQYSVFFGEGKLDPTGKDFIAIGDYNALRTDPPDPEGLFFHYVVEYWHCPCKIDQKERRRNETIEACKRDGLKAGVVPPYVIDSWQLYPDYGGGEYRVWATNRFEWIKHEVVIAFLVNNHATHRAQNVLPLFQDDDPAIVKQKWDNVNEQVKGYQWAEDKDYAPTIQYNVSLTLKNWPRSAYASLGTNSNTFVRTILKGSAIPVVEMKGSHPGNNDPRQNGPSNASYHVDAKPWRQNKDGKDYENWPKRPTIDP